jgi:TolB-like protein/Tfp pilus assembly protein PilF
MSKRMIELKLLGRAELRGKDGELDHSFLAGPKRLALLAYLVLNRPAGFQRRDRILPLLWPETNQKSARNSLSNMLFHLRKSLGKDSIQTRGTEELAIDYDILWCDALEFRSAVKERNWSEAERLYKGELLSGLFIPNTGKELELWLDKEREILRKHYLETLEKLAARAEKRNRLDEAIKWWQSRNQEDSLDTKSVERLVRVLAQTGKKNEAIREAEQHARLIEEEFGYDAGSIIQSLEKIIQANTQKADPQSGQYYNSDIRSIAVLPFEEIGQNSEMSDFANGLHHDLLTRLAGVSGFKVISRTSVLQYRNSRANIKEISEDLDVNFIVEGAIQASGGQMRLHVQLIDAVSDRHHTAITYNSELTGDTIFDVQTELAEKITKRLKKELSPNEKKQVLNKPTQNLEAYLLYTQGRTYLNQRTERSLSRAVLCFQDSLKHDKEYAQGWAGLAETLLLIEWYNYEAVDTGIDSIQAAFKALSLNPDLAEAHLSMGILHSHQQNGPDAIRELETAIKLQPSYAEAYNWLGWMRMIIGRMDEAVAPAEQSAKLDPHSTSTRTYLATVLLAACEYQKALEQTILARAIQPEFGIPYYLEGLAQFHLKNYDEAVFALNEALKLLNTEGALSKNDILFVIALINQINGESVKVEEFLNSVEMEKDYITSGLIYACMNKTDKAFKEFEKTEQWGPFPTAVIRYLFPGFLKPLREDPRYSFIMQKVNKSWQLKE